jgi:excisionase family DNA binding protein
MANVREVMDGRQAADYLGISIDVLYRYLSEKEKGIPAFKLGNRWKIKKTELDRWMETRSTKMLSDKERRGMEEVSPRPTAIA